MDKLTENLLTLKHILNIDEDKAILLLNKKIIVTSHSTSQGSAASNSLVQFLEKSFQCITQEIDHQVQYDLEIILGNHLPRTNHSQKIYIYWNDYSLNISSKNQGAIDGSLHPILLKLGMAYACGPIFCQLTEEKYLGLGEKNSIELNFLKYFDNDLSFLTTEIDVGLMHLAGLGATGTWLLEGCSLLNLKGEIKGYDEDVVSEGNTQRTPYRISQVGQKKVYAYQSIFSPLNQELKFTPIPNRIQKDVSKTNELINKLISCVDSRRARRNIQDLAPRYIFDCSTTDISAVTLFFSKLDSNQACLACLYYENIQENARTLDLASTLGIEVEEAKELNISQVTASKIVLSYPSFIPEEIIGIPYDTFYKQLCSQGKLRASKDNSSDTINETLAPLCHVSVIAGLLLAIEIARRHAIGLDKLTEWNYWPLSPWSEPQIKMATTLNVREQCTFHNSMIEMAQNIWKQKENEKSNSRQDL